MHSPLKGFSRGKQRVMTRRMCFALIITLFPGPTCARPKLGDEEWMRRFCAFVRTLIAFVEVLNEGTFDLSRCHGMRDAWKKLDAE